MKQGVLTNTRVRLLLTKGLSCYRQRKRGERKRKSVRGCIVGADLAVLNLVVTKKGDAEIEGLTDSQVPRRLGPKRASKIRKLFALSKDDDVRKYVIRRELPSKTEVRLALALSKAEVPLALLSGTLALTRSRSRSLHLFEPPDPPQPSLALP